LSIAAKLLLVGVTIGGTLAVRTFAGKGQAQWVANRLAENSVKPKINIGAKRSKWGDVLCDIHPQGSCVWCNAEDLSQFPDKTFSVALLSHVMEHCENPERALAEAQRIADNVVVELPSPLDVTAWTCPSHRWVFIGNNKISLNPALATSLLTVAGLGIFVAIVSSGRQK
jgi:hypothetical protein